MELTRANTQETRSYQRGLVRCGEQKTHGHMVIPLSSHGALEGRTSFVELSILQWG